MTTVSVSFLGLEEDSSQEEWKKALLSNSMDICMHAPEVVVQLDVFILRKQTSMSSFFYLFTKINYIYTINATTNPTVAAKRREATARRGAAPRGRAEGRRRRRRRVGRRRGRRRTSRREYPCLGLSKAWIGTTNH